MSGAIKWSMRHHQLIAEAFDNVTEAIEAALSASNAETEAFVMIESGDEPRVVSLGKDPRVIAIEERRDEARAAYREREPRTMYEVIVEKPGDKDWRALNAVVETTATLDEAQKEASDLASVVGAARVSIREVIQ